MPFLVLNHFNGADGATTFTDAVAGISWSSSGATPELDTAVQKFGSASLKCTGDGSDGATAKTSSFASLSGDWTVQAFFQLSSNTTFGGIILTADNDVTTYLSIFINLLVANEIRTRVESDTEILVNRTDSITVVSGIQHHIALVRDTAADTYELFLDGARQFSVSHSGDISSGAVRCQLFSTASSTQTIWFDEIAVSDAVEYSGASYTVPTEEFEVGPAEVTPAVAEFSFAADSLILTSNLPTNGGEFDLEWDSVNQDVLNLVAPSSCEFDVDVGSSYLPESAFLRSHEWSSADLDYVPEFTPGSNEFDWEGTPPSVAMLFNITPQSAEFDMEWEGVDTRYFILGITPHHRRMDGGRRSLNRRIDHVRRRVDVPAEV